jgi:hypothetical protein
MPTERRLIAGHRSLRTLVALVAAVALGGCGGSSSATFATSAPAAARPLVVVETRGGECPRAACGSTVIIESGGRVHSTAPTPAELGSVPESILDGLATEIARTDFEELKSHPFTGTCPVAYDGQETVYTFSTSSGHERIASCEVQIDPSDPLFVAVGAALTAAAT